MHIPEMQLKIKKKSFIFEILVFEVVVGNSAYCNGYTCHRQSVCWQKVWRIQIKQMQAFYNSIYLEFMEKYDNSGVVLIWAVSGTR